ncbi:MAG: response regulator transcription factor [Betaproteobacteria bacterium]|nr:response regulator transcription factor [Betaproteobacteria bacterium]
MVKVMLVDDSASFRMAAEQFVTEVCGVHVIGQADSGEAAVEMALRLRPEVILMDLAMGGINGIEAGRRIKAADETIKIVILTLNNGREYRELAHSLALDGFVSKTDFTAVICSVINSL